MDEDEISSLYTQMDALEQLRYAVKARQVNDELLEHLSSTLWWLLHYAAKNNIDLPDKDKIGLALDRAMAIARKQPHSRATTHLSTPKGDTPEDDRTIIIIIIITDYLPISCRLSKTL